MSDIIAGGGWGFRVLELQSCGGLGVWCFWCFGFLLSIGVVQLWGFDGLGSRFGGLGVSEAPH